MQKQEGVDVLWITQLLYGTRASLMETRWTCCLFTGFVLKGKVHPKMRIQSLSTCWGTFVEVRNKTALQRSPKQPKQMETWFKDVSGSPEVPNWFKWCNSHPWWALRLVLTVLAQQLRWKSLLKATTSDFDILLILETKAVVFPPSRPQAIIKMILLKKNLLLLLFNWITCFIFV